MDNPFVDELTAALGADRVLSKPGDLFFYAYDAALEKRLPAAVVLPRSAEEAAKAVDLARRHKVPFSARGAGTNLCGGSVPARGGLVVHFSRMNRILSIDQERRRAWVEPGVVNLQLQKALAPLGLFYAPDPASQKACTLGGNVGTNAGGPHCLKYGVTSTHVTGLEVVLADGTLARFSVDDPGYDMTGFFVGAEGTLGVVTKIEVNLLPSPPAVETFLAPFPSMEAAAQTVSDIIAAGLVPTTLEVMDKLTVQAVEAFVGAGYPTDAEAVLLIEVDGGPAETRAAGERIRAIAQKNGAPEFRWAADQAARDKLWEGRRGAYPAMARLAPNVLVEDGVVPRTRLPEAVKRLRRIAEDAGVRLGLIAHAGDGNLHPNMIFDERDPGETRRVKKAGEDMMRVCVELGGSISGEHGIGTDKREAMRWLFTPETLHFFAALKKSLDPENLANPGKSIPEAPREAARPTPEPPQGRERVADAGRLAALLAGAQSAGRAVFLRGAGTAGAAPRQGETVLDLSGLDRLIDHDHGNFTLTVGAGIPLNALRRLLAERGQYLHIPGNGSLGGAIAAGAPGVRDQVLGMKVVLLGGVTVQLGGKVVKNVAGYDAAKLFMGSWGTLGAIAEATVRLHPLPMPEKPFTLPAPPAAFAAAPADPRRRIKNALDPEHLMNPTLFPREAVHA